MKQQIKFPWYVKLLAAILKPRVKPEMRKAIETIESVQKYKKFGKSKYLFDYQYDIKKKKFKAMIKIIF